MINGFTNLGRQATNPQWQYPDVWNPKINYSWVVDRHSLKFGYEFQHIQTEVQDVNPLYGRDAYAGQFTRPITAAASTFYNLSDFMFGYRSQYALSNILVANLRQNMQFAYVQDDWRVNDALTLNLGLRYEYATPHWERDNILSNFDPVTRTMVLAQDGSLEDRSTIQPDRNNLGPRLGFAYTITPKTVSRGGYGVSFIHFHRAGGANLLPINGPQVINAVENQVDPASAGFRPTELGYPADLTDPSRFNPLRANITYMPRDYESSRVQSWYVSVQRELWRNTILDVAYVGNRADGQLLFANLNQAVPNAPGESLPLQARRPIAEYGDITYSWNGGFSRYHSAQIRFESRLRGLMLLNSLTLSRARDNGAGSLESPNGNFPAPQDFYNMAAEEALSGYNQPYNNTTSVVWDVPVGRDRKWLADVSPWLDLLIGGWQVAGISTLAAGEAVTLHLHADGAGAGVRYPAGLPWCQQLPSQHRRRPVRRPRFDDQLFQSRHGADSDREQPVRQRAAQQRARTRFLAGRSRALEERATADRQQHATAGACGGLQPAQSHELPRARGQSQRQQLRQHHQYVRPAAAATRREGELLATPSLGRPNRGAPPGWMVCAAPLPRNLVRWATWSMALPPPRHSSRTAMASSLPTCPSPITRVRC